MSAELKVTVTDDDRGIVFTPTSLTVEEGDATGETYTVKLATEPSEEVTVTVSGHSGTDLTLSGLSPTSTLTFTTANWNTAQTVTVKAADDADGTDDAVTLAHAASGGNYEDVSAELKVTVTDDDRAIVFSPTSLTVVEEDTTGASYTVKLATEPSDTVTVTVTGHDSTDLTVDGLSAADTLTFTTTDWNTPRTVTVKAGDDADGDDYTATLTHTASGGNYADVSADLKVTVTHDATLSALVVSPKDITGFDPDRASYEVGVASTVARATVSATATDANATVSITPADADDGTDGHQVALSAGRNAVTVTVTAENGVTTMVYTVSVNRGVTALTGWKAADDLDGLIAAGNVQPQGVWSDGTTMWIADRDDAKLYAYRVSDGARDSARDFDTLSDAGNNDPYGIWSDGTTMWVADPIKDKLYAYRMSDKARDPDKDFGTLSDAGNNVPVGIWSDGTTMWVADNFHDKLFAYRMSDRNRDPDKDFDTLSDAGNNDPSVIWSDGTTMWVADIFDDKLYAYRMYNRARDSTKDFDTLRAAGNRDPTGIWSDGATMWVADVHDGKVYSYNPAPDDATLSALTVSPKDLIGFDPDRASYEVGVASTVARGHGVGHRD